MDAEGDRKTGSGAGASEALGARKPLRTAVLASGNGSNLQALIDHFEGSEEVEIALVCSDKKDAHALERSSNHGIESAVFARADHPDREARDRALADRLEASGIDLVVLAGYMQLLSGSFVRRFKHRIINVHPALLPAFPGLDAIGQALDYGVKVAGVTVHFVDEGVDTGPIILQRAFELPYTRPTAEIEQLVHEIEHQLLPQAVSLFARGAIRIDAENPRLVRIDEH